MLIQRRSVSFSTDFLSDYSPVLQRIFAARGILSATELDKGLQALLPFQSLLNIDKACLRLEAALAAEQRIVIIGDFDADGATSTALAVSALRAMGALHVTYLVPNRFTFGYGLTPGIVALAAEDKPDLIITVDNGIASIEGVDAANAAGIDVIITDHHLPADTLPKAHAIVNPNQVGDVFLSKSIAGVGVIFYVMLALRRHLISKNWFESQQLPVPNMAQFLDLVALGTVADVVGLDQNNRILVNQGLLRIRQGLARPGILALLEVAGRVVSTLSASDLGFIIAPRLNAAGRLDDMSLGIACLLSDGLEPARGFAKRLDALNVERRKIESDMSEQALAVLQTLTANVENGAALPLVLCLFDASWHQGVIGILAGRLKERYHRPVIIFAQTSETEIKGSARSIPGLNIRDVLASIDRDHPHLIKKFGGHAMAAGMSLDPNDLPAFRDALIKEVNQHLDESQCGGTFLSDGPLEKSDFSLDLAHQLQAAGPWGQQFPEPRFDNVFEILDQRLVGERHLKLTLSLTPNGEPIDAIAFQVDLKQWPNHRARYVHALYTLGANTYQGRTRLQLIIITMQESHHETPQPYTHPLIADTHDVMG